MYVDFMAPADDPEVEAALKEVREHTSMLNILGLPLRGRTRLTP